MPTPSRAFLPSTRHLAQRGAVAGALLVLAGCAQQQAPGYYAQPRGNSISDAQFSAEGANYRNVVRAPSQLQISLDPPANPDQAQSRGQMATGPLAQAGAPARTDAAVPAAPATAGSTPEAIPVGERPAPPRAAAGAGEYNPAAAQFAPQAQTYMGTLPCLGPNMACSGQRVTLTLAPNGRWRARIEFLPDGQAAPVSKPMVEQGCWDATTIRPIRVLLRDAKGNTRMDFESLNSALVVRSMDGQAPNLTYSLTRQPDLDPIDELSSAKLPSCN